jgi:hypothetical protein
MSYNDNYVFPSNDDHSPSNFLPSKACQIFSHLEVLRNINFITLHSYDNLEVQISETSA